MLPFGSDIIPLRLTFLDQKHHLSHTLIRLTAWHHDCFQLAVERQMSIPELASFPRSTHPSCFSLVGKELGVWRSCEGDRIIAAFSPCPFSLLPGQDAQPNAVRADHRSSYVPAMMTTPRALRCLCSMDSPRLPEGQESMLQKPYKQ